MPSLTAKQIRKAKRNPKEQVAQAAEDIKAMTAALKGWNVGVFDIETTGLAADFGHMISACVASVNTGKMQTFRIDDYKGYKKNLCDDKQLVLDFRDALAEYDVLIHFNGENFDYPFLDTRLAIYGEKRSVLTHTIDLLPICRKKLRLHSNRLSSVAAALDLKHRKTPLDIQVWKRASYGSSVDLDYIVSHNQADVLVTMEAFLRLKEHIDVIYRRR